jgi:hypothetical protein
MSSRGCWYKKNIVPGVLNYRGKRLRERMRADASSGVRVNFAWVAGNKSCIPYQNQH